MNKRRPEHIIKRSRELRQEMTYSETLMWNALRRQKQRGLKFRRQHPIIGFIADFYCAEYRLIIEIDGGVHDDTAVKERDTLRQEALERAGFKVIRFTNDEVLQNIDNVINQILLACGQKPY